MFNLKPAGFQIICPVELVARFVLVLAFIYVLYVK